MSDITVDNATINQGARAYTRFVRCCVIFYRCIWRFGVRYCLSFRKVPAAKYAYMTICRKKDLDMVLASVYSLYLHGSEVPKKIILVSDGSWNPEEGVAWFNRYRLPIECLPWQTCAQYYEDSCPALSQWAAKHIWGKKMAAIAYCSEFQPVLFCDPDVLWFRAPVFTSGAHQCPFKISVDNSISYDRDALHAMAAERLSERREPVNCGVVYMSGGLALLGETARRLVEYEAEHCGPFAEQTVFAAMDEQYDCRWSRDEVRSDIEAALTPLRGTTEITHVLMARHYLWLLKPLYWRDLFRMFFRKGAK